MTAVVSEIGRFELMRPRRGDSTIMERAHHIRIRPVRPRLRPCLRGGSSATWRSGCSSGVGACERAASSSLPKSDIVCPRYPLRIAELFT